MQLGDITEPKIDQSGPPSSGEFTYVDISSIDNKTKRIIEPKRLPVDAAPSRARQRLRAGDVLVSMTRPNLNAVALVPLELDGAVGSTGFHVLRARDNVLPQWLYYGVQSRGFVGAMSELVQGALYPAVRPKDIRAFDLPVPDQCEQRRIVAEIEKQFSRLDEAVANLKRVKANLKRYKAAVLKAAVEGALGAEGLEGNSKSELSLLDTETTQAGRFAVPKTWTWSTCGAVIERIEAGASFKCIERPPVADEVGVVKVSAVTWGIFNESESKTCVDSNRVNERLMIRPGDFLFSRANTIDLVGACVIADAMTRRLMLSDKILRFLPKDNVAAEWLLICLRSRFGRAEIKRLATGNQESMRNIGQDRIRQIRIPLPPLAEQRRIVAEVDRHLSIVREVEIEADANLKRALALRQAVLARSFAS